MHYSDEAVRLVARQMGAEAVANREDLEARFTPLIRTVLRTGYGRPGLVNWLRKHLPYTAPPAGFHNSVEAERFAPRMARLLCAQLLKNVQNKMTCASTRDTVVGF